MQKSGFPKMHHYVGFWQIGSHIPYSRKVWWGIVWRIDLFRAFGKRKFGKLIDQPIDY